MKTILCAALTLTAISLTAKANITVAEWNFDHPEKCENSTAGEKITAPQWAANYGNNSWSDGVLHWASSEKETKRILLPTPIDITKAENKKLRITIVSKGVIMPPTSNANRKWHFKLWNAGKNTDETLNASVFIELTKPEGIVTIVSKIQGLPTTENFTHGMVFSGPFTIYADLDFAAGSVTIRMPDNGDAQLGKDTTKSKIIRPVRKFEVSDFKVNAFNTIEFKTDIGEQDSLSLDLVKLEILRP